MISVLWKYLNLRNNGVTTFKNHAIVLRRLLPWTATVPCVGVNTNTFSFLRKMVMKRAITLFSSTKKISLFKMSLRIKLKTKFIEPSFRYKVSALDKIWRQLVPRIWISRQKRLKLQMGVAGPFFEPHPSNLVRIHFFLSCKSAEIFVALPQMV